MGVVAPGEKNINQQKDLWWFILYDNITIQGAKT